MYSSLLSPSGVGFLRVEDSAISQGDEYQQPHQSESAKSNKSFTILVSPLSCYMISPLAFTSSCFSTLTHPREIYEISLSALEEISKSVTSFAYKKVAN